jgi:DNA-binding IclR family transcriptional regulator
MGKKKKLSKQIKYNLMVLKLLKELSKVPEARLSIREISRTLKINAMAASRSIKTLEPILDIKSGSDFENFRLRLKLIRLKPGFEKLSETELIKRVDLSKKLLKEVY